MAQIAAEWIKIPDGNGGLKKVWVRDSQARRDIATLNTAVAGKQGTLSTAQMNAVNSGITAAKVATYDAISVPTAYTSNPEMDGTASAGSSGNWARGDHVHPTDTSRQAALSTAQLNAVNSGVTAAKVATWDAIDVPTKTSDLTNDSGFITASAVPDPSSAAPSMDGTAAAGSSDDYARADHVHPSDTAKQDALDAAQLAAVNSGIDAAKVAIYEGLTKLTLTYTSNSYVSASNFNRLSCYRVGMHLAVLVANIRISAAMTDGAWHEIGSIPASLAVEHYQVLATQTAGGSTMLVNITSAGKIMIYSLTGVSGSYYRAMIPLIVSSFN